MTRLISGKDANNTPMYDIKFSNESYHANMAQTDVLTLAVPANAKTALISITPGATILVGSEEISAPTPAFTQTSSQINPASRDIKYVDTLHFYAETAGIVNVSFYED